MLAAAEEKDDSDKRRPKNWIRLLETTKTAAIGYDGDWKRRRMDTMAMDEERGTTEENDRREDSKDDLKNEEDGF